VLPEFYPPDNMKIAEGLGRSLNDFSAYSAIVMHSAIDFKVF
jgi:hypothetical protein